MASAQVAETSDANNSASQVCLLRLKANGTHTHTHTHTHTNVGYVDDSYLQGPSFDDCSNNVQDTVHLFTKVGFLSNQEKSILIPSQALTVLGFILNSLTMTVKPTPEKAGKL